MAGGQGAQTGITRRHKEPSANNGTVHSPVIMVSQVHTYAQTNQIIYLKYVGFIMCQLHLNKAPFKKQGSPYWVPETISGFEPEKN